MKRDLKNNVDQAQSLAPAARNASVNGSGVDLQGYQSAMVIFNVGTVTDGTHTPKIQESDDNSTFTDVAASDQQGTFAALASSTPQRVGYIGGKRYIRAVQTVAGATTGAVTSATVLRGDPGSAPLA